MNIRLFTTIVTFLFCGDTEITWDERRVKVEKQQRCTKQKKKDSYIERVRKKVIKITWQKNKINKTNKYSCQFSHKTKMNSSLCL